MPAAGREEGGEVSATVPEDHREVLDAPYAVLSTLGGDVEITPDDDYAFARHVGRWRTIGPGYR
jgi:hypothetical protein